MTLLRPNLNEIYGPIEKELEEFGEVLKKQLASQDTLIQDIHQHLLKMTGKFLRPALVILCSKLGHKNNSMEAIRLAAAIELIHTATLVHDDIIDDSEYRRNQPSVHSKWGREISIVSGDYLYAKAFLLLADLKDIWVNQAFAACAHVICEGEMKQIEKRADFFMDEKEYLRIIHQKTASLFQAACVGGAYYSGLGKDKIEKLGDFGFRLGMAFQIIDDCLDLMSDVEHLGKPAGLDIHKHDATLPILYLFKSLDEAEKRSLLEEIKRGGPSLLETVRRLAIEKKSIEKATLRAKNYLEEAVRNLADFNGSAYKESLLQLADHCLERAR